mmetsp:Transcript_4742/g.20353  ORF Transcript_4742/g.20353 Transcript_4742/m.20353 type:complete len:90 (+) Transcript_4742:2292-2561(+)
MRSLLDERRVGQDLSIMAEGFTFLFCDYFHGIATQVSRAMSKPFLAHNLGFLCTFITANCDQGAELTMPYIVADMIDQSSGLRRRSFSG